MGGGEGETGKAAAGIDRDQIAGLRTSLGNKRLGEGGDQKAAQDEKRGLTSDRFQLVRKSQGKGKQKKKKRVFECRTYHSRQSSERGGGQFNYPHEERCKFEENQKKRKGRYSPRNA